MSANPVTSKSQPTRKPTVAIVGASSDPSKYSHRSLVAHLKAGFDVYPVNPRADTIAGLRSYRSVTEIPVELDRVSLYVPPSVGVGLLPEIAAKGCRELWVNPGAESPELMQKAAQLGLNAIYACSYLDATHRGQDSR
ncbi:MAG: CoA-binding protein [Verrucomicrobiae bacterium]|nr:CoA-binding protein [Verrucomicrobiae bacterium]MDW8343981.1 CoA-binding protein [Verrucomicrobiae bacterium]